MLIFLARDLCDVAWGAKTLPRLELQRHFKVSRYRLLLLFPVYLQSHYDYSKAK